MLQRQVSYHSYEDMCNAEGTRLASHPDLVTEQVPAATEWATSPSQGHTDTRLFLGLRRNADTSTALVSREYEPMDQAAYDAAYDGIGTGQGCRVLDTGAVAVEGEACQDLLPTAEPKRRRGLCQYTDCYSDSTPAYPCVFPFRFLGLMGNWANINQ